MFNLRVIQAYHGDCFIVEYGKKDQPKNMLIDSGPKQSYYDNLRPELLKIRDTGGNLERVVISHVCNDHIDGLVELFLDLREEHIAIKQKTIEIKSIWFNQFSETIGKGEKIKDKLFTFSQQSLDFGTRNTLNELNYSIARADGLIKVIKPFNIPINPETDMGIISVENLPNAIVEDNLLIHIIGPDQSTINKLREEWLEWIDKKGRYTNPFFKAMSDRSYQNLSSIVLLLESSGKRILLTGDARGDFIIRSLEKKGFLKKTEPFFVDILKIPHHGSERNVSEEFFEKIISDTYIISAQKHGKTDNPDLSSLEWIINSAQKRGKKITVFITNENNSTRETILKYGDKNDIAEIQILAKKEKSKVFVLF